MPNFFWDSEPTLHPLYVAIREYLEIDPRIKVLNERCRVFLDLAEILADSVADAKMSYITWIIIVLIVISILVTVTEVGLRFGILSKNNGKGGEKADLVAVPLIGAGSGQQQMQLPSSVKWELEKRNVSVEEVRLWSRMLCEEEGEGAKCGGQIVGETYAGV